MALPVRSLQSQIEANSLRILRNSLPKEWIFRHETEDDYGIDVEIELVTRTGIVPGDFIKAQVKGSTKVQFSDNGRFGVSGIKQSTLNYWIGLCKYINVIAFLVDTAEEKVYWTPLFWKSVKTLDNTDSTKTIHFAKASDLSRPMAQDFLLLSCLEPTPSKVTESHKRVLRHFADILDLFYDSGSYDSWAGPDDDVLLRLFFEELGVLCYFEQIASDQSNVFSVSHWHELSLNLPGEFPTYKVINDSMNILLPILCDKLSSLKDNVIQSKFYWTTKDPYYLALVEAIEVPATFEATQIQGLANKLRAVCYELNYMLWN